MSSRPSFPTVCSTSDGGTRDAGDTFGGEPRRLAAVARVCVSRLCQSIGGGLARADSEPAKADSVAVGYEIFNREWMPNDPRSHGGDGLGPVYNDSSCVACHNSGGSGGAGPVSKNIDILNASRNLGRPAQRRSRSTASRRLSATAAIDPLLRCPRRVPDQPNGRPAQVRHRPQL